jgi:hypothetical protein
MTDAESLPATPSLMLVLTRPRPGTTENEFNAWYDDIHVPELLAGIPGIAAVSRYRLNQTVPTAAGQDARPFLALYHLDGSPEDVMAALRQPGATQPALLLDPDTPPTVLMFDRIGRGVTARP